jgi:hypothetical protein
MMREPDFGLIDDWDVWRTDVLLEVAIAIHGLGAPQLIQCERDVGMIQPHFAQITPGIVTSFIALAS